MTTTLEQLRQAAIHRARRLQSDGKIDERRLEALLTVEPSAMTLKDVQTEIVERLVAKWGEQERGPSWDYVRQAYPTLGLALNKLAHWDIANIDYHLSAQAIMAMTDQDVRRLRQGG